MKFPLQGFEDLELSTQLIIHEARQRGVNVEVLDREDNFISLTKNGQTEYIKQATRTGADTYISALMMENKFVTNEVLRANEISVPSGIQLHHNHNLEEVYEHYKESSIVVKPKRTNFGKGVVTLHVPYTLQAIHKAVREAFNYDNSVLIEEFIAGPEYRFLVIGDQVPAVLHRVPANVSGDDRKTIRELIDKKNSDPLRGQGYVTPLEKIRPGAEERDFLKEQAKTWETVPASGEIVYLRKNSNISTGGDSLDFTDDVHPSYKKIAVKAARAVGANICGADLIITDIKKAATTDNYSIIELNFNPALHIHDFPYKGRNRNVEKYVLELVGF